MKLERGEIHRTFVSVSSPGSSSEFPDKRTETPFLFFDRKLPADRIKSTYLPHWIQGGVLYFVTFRLADSLPQEKLIVWKQERTAWLKQHPEPHEGEVRKEYFKRFPKRLQAWLDQDYGSLILRRPEARAVVENALRHFEGERYYLDEFVVAANHVHVLVSPQNGHQLSEILHSWKSFSAKKILQLDGIAGLFEGGHFWQRESWDHIVRSENSLERFRRYIRGHRVFEG